MPSSTLLRCSISNTPRKTSQNRLPPSPHEDTYPRK
ncbi:rCG28236 [Rattus norvegicus]|uniref:RCG28236 n=1 Tax=Rattus norvegicus TaxID=10116 RepID=A6IEK8_RAT|nr:rCG28236 [Rattus norvegicus]